MEEHELVSLWISGGIYADVHYMDHITDVKERSRDMSHIHSYCEIYFNLSGDVSFAVENKVYPICPGDIIITKPNEIHYCIYNSDSIHRGYCLWLDADKEFEFLLAPFLDRVNGEQNRISLSEEEAALFAENMETLKKAYDTRSFPSIESMSAFTNILEIIDRHKADRQPPESLPEILRRILDYIDAHFVGDCSTNKLCAEFFLSRSSLNRLFKSNLDTTPSKYLEDRRLAHAKHLLSDGYSVQGTCEKCGFADYSHFISLFKQRFGITPLKYRKTQK